MTCLDEKANAIVAEMVELGAVFIITDTGPTGQLRWSWSPEPEIMRNVIRRIWTATEERAAPGFNAAMIAAIRRHQAGGADVR